LVEGVKYAICVVGQDFARDLRVGGKGPDPEIIGANSHGVDGVGGGERRSEIGLRRVVAHRGFVHKIGWNLVFEDRGKSALMAVKVLAMQISKALKDEKVIVSSAPW